MTIRNHDKHKALLTELRELVTEQRNPRTRDLDLVELQECLRLINAEDRGVPEAVGREIPHIAAAVRLTEASLRQGGRIVYVGAGTSGRLGVLDASECPPTFGTHPDQVIGIMAGGPAALVRSQEGVEDDEKQVQEDLQAIALAADDTLVAITASRRTPYARQALRYARRQGASTVFITCNQPPADVEADVVIAVVVGPEVVSGSTRMKAGTAQKLVLNMISTATMVRLGKVYENLMVDLRPNSAKLEERSKGILMQLLDVDYDDAAILLKEAGNSVKTALFMHWAGCGRVEAEERLAAVGGVLRKALGASK